jgi:carbon-monoxide dehydrogenase small subunit
VSKKVHVTTVINGRETEFLCEPRQSLLEVLRDELRLTGTKEGCNNGNCGACNVILDGRLVNSCLVLGVETQRREVTTIEGIASPQGLHPLQQKFLECAALQCGVCTPGFIIAAKALLEQKPNPTEHEVRHYLAGNLCRCTGYDKIIRAVLDAAATMAPEEKPKAKKRAKSSGAAPQPASE